MFSARGLAGLLISAIILTFFGCSKKSESTGPIPNEELTEKQKVHIDDLNKQRQEEWKKRD